MVDAFPRLSVLIGVFGLLSGVVPVLMLVAMGQMVGAVPGTVAHGLGSTAGHKMIRSLVFFAIVFSLLLCLAPFRAGLATVTRTRFTFWLRSRLMGAVSGPVGTEHLEDPALLDRLALAQGSLSSFDPGDAPVSFAASTGFRLQGILACAFIGEYRWWLGLVTALFWLGIGGPVTKNGTSVLRLSPSDAAVMRRAEYFNSLPTNQAAAKEIRVYGLGHWTVGEMRRHWESVADRAWRASFRPIFLTNAWTSVAQVVFIGLFGAYVVHQAYTGVIGIGTAVTQLTLLQLARNLGMLSPVVFAFAAQLASFPHFGEIEAELAGRATDDEGGDPAGGLPQEAIAFSSVSFHYPGARTDVFSELDLVIRAGQATAIVGPNGIGKTTLVKLLCRLQRPVGGRILVDRRDLDELDARGWQRRCAVVFQDFNRYPTSFEENVTFGAIEHGEDRAGALAAVGRAGAGEILDGLEQGWDTPLVRGVAGGVDLSGGQWQRVALARALFAVEHGAGVLVLDEPTANLDVRGEAAFYERFFELTRGLTTVVISHRFSTVRLADQIYVLDTSGVVEQGSHAELMALGGSYARAFNLQASRFAGPDEDTGDESGEASQEVPTP